MLLGLPTSMPTLVLPLPFWAAVEPNTSALLTEMFAYAPIAVALVRAPEAASAWKPTNVLVRPLRLVYPARAPNAVLASAGPGVEALHDPLLFAGRPVLNRAQEPTATPSLAEPLAAREAHPLAVLLLPVVLEPSEPPPVAVLEAPTVLEKSAPLPVAVFKVPVVL